MVGVGRFDVVPALEGLIKPFKDVVKTLTDGFTQATKNVKTFGDGVSGLKGPLADLKATVANLTDTLSKVTGVSVPTTVEPLPEAQAASQAGLLETVGGVLGGLATAGAALAGAFQGITSAARPFVEALSPNTIFQFDRASRDLAATIGQALQPVMEVLTGTLRSFASIIEPLAEELRPIFQEAAQAFSDLLIPVVQTVVGIFQALEPVIQLVVDVFEVLTNLLKPLLAVVNVAASTLGGLFEVLYAVLTPVIDAFKLGAAVIGQLAEVINAVAVVVKTAFQVAADSIKAVFAPFGEMKDVFKALREITHVVIKAFYQLVASLAMVFGGAEAGGNFINKLLDNLKPKEGKTAVAGPASLKSFQQIANDLATSSAMAGGKTEEQKDEKAQTLSYFKDIAEALKDIKDGTGGLGGFVKILVRVAEAFEKARDFFTPSKKFPYQAKGFDKHGNVVDM